MHGENELKGHVENIRVKHNDEELYDLVYFDLVNHEEDAIMKRMPCYMVVKPEISKQIAELKAEKVYIAEGCICSDGKNIDFQVHVIYEEPVYINY